MKTWVLATSPLLIFILLLAGDIIIDYFQQKELVRRKCTPEDFTKDPFN